MRYKDMVRLKKKSAKEITNTKYTTVTVKGQKTMSRGWSDLGKLRFKELTELVVAQRQSEDWIKDRRKYIQRKCMKEFGGRKRKRNGNDQNNYNLKMNKEERSTWDDFINNSMNDLAWAGNTVAL